MSIAGREAYREDDKATFRTYLFTVARNIFIDERRSAAHRYVSDAPFEVDSLVDSMVESSETLTDKVKWRERLLEHFATLSGDQQEVLSLWVEGFSFEEIAAVTGVSRMTVIGRKRYGIENLRKQIADKGTRGDDETHD
jgi:RNA polymerase sigma-70 factor (ECF subfamily)